MYILVFLNELSKQMMNQNLKWYESEREKLPSNLLKDN